MLIPKNPPIRDAKHLAFIRTLGCIICGNEAEAAHIRIAGDGGMGMKPSDSSCVPLCPLHHREQHNTSEVRFYYPYGGHERARILAKELYAVTGSVFEAKEKIRKWKQRT